MTEKKWCGYHQKMEPLCKFGQNAFKESGLQDHCKEAQNKFVNTYYHSNEDLCNEKTNLYHKWRAGKITTEQKNTMVRRLNSRYGIKTRVK